MTYEETAKLVSSINNVETWAKSIARELSKPAGEFDGDHLRELQGWLAEAKQDIFDIASK